MALRPRREGKLLRKKQIVVPRTDYTVANNIAGSPMLPVFCGLPTLTLLFVMMQHLVVAALLPATLRGGVFHFFVVVVLLMQIL